MRAVLLLRIFMGKSAAAAARPFNSSPSGQNLTCVLGRIPLLFCGGGWRTLYFAQLSAVRAFALGGGTEMEDLWNRTLLVVLLQCPLQVHCQIGGEVRDTGEQEENLKRVRRSSGGGGGGGRGGNQKLEHDKRSLGTLHASPWSDQGLEVTTLPPSPTWGINLLRRSDFALNVTCKMEWNRGGGGG